MFSYLFYKLSRFIATTLPLEKAYSFAEKVAIWRYYLSFKDKKIVASNLKTVLQAKGESFDKDKIKELTEEVYKNFAKYLVEFFRFSEKDKAFINEKTKIEGLENLDQAMSEGKGVIALGAHLGNWELAAVLLASLNYPVNAITLLHKNKAVNDIFDKQRVARGLRVIPTGMAIKRCYQVLKNNEIIGFLGDKDFFRSGIWMRFLSKKTLMPKGPAVFSLKTQAPIVPIFSIRQKDNSFKIVIEKPIKPRHLRNQDHDVKFLTRKIIDVIERYIKEYPSQWLMFHKVWDF